MAARLGLPPASLLLLLPAFAALAEYDRDPVGHLDATVAAALHAIAVPSATSVVQAVTLLGGTAVLSAVAVLGAGLLALRGRRRDGLFLLVVFAGAEVLTWTLKAIVRRDRPSFDDPIATATSFSYPSGHALVSLAVYGALALILTRGRSERWAIACVALVVAAVGFSRLYLGVHYVSDVLAGWIAGAAWLLLAQAFIWRDEIYHRGLWRCRSSSSSAATTRPRGRLRGRSAAPSRAS